MQITIDTAYTTQAELIAVAELLSNLAGQFILPTVTAPPPAVLRTFADIPQDRPDAGKLPDDDIAAAALFGGQSLPNVPVFVPPAPPPAASPVSAMVAPATVAAPSGGVNLDATGLPWDARIHAGSKVKNADGSWRQRRGLNDDALLRRVETELRAVMALPPGAAAPAAVFAIPVVPAVPAQAPLIPTVPAAPVQPAPATFQEFMMAATVLVQQNRLTAEEMTVKLQSIGLPGIMALASRPDLIADAWRVVSG